MRIKAAFIFFILLHFFGVRLSAADGTAANAHTQSHEVLLINSVFSNYDEALNASTIALGQEAHVFYRVPVPGEKPYATDIFQSRLFLNCCISSTQFLRQNLSDLLSRLYMLNRILRI